MFDALRNDPSLEAAVVTDVTVAEITFDEALSEAAEFYNDLIMFSDDDNLAGMEETLENLTSLESAVAAHGISKSLLAFADKDGLLSTAVPGIPSLEALLADLSVEDSAAALEGLGTTIKSVAKAIGAAYVYNFTHMFDYNPAEERIEMWKHLIDGIEKNLEDKHFSKEKAETIKGKLLPYEKLMALLKAYAEAPKALIALWSTELPTKEGEFAPWMEKVRHEVEAVFKTEEAKITDKGTLTMPLKRYLVLRFGEEGTLARKGYASEECMKEIISGFRHLQQAFLSLKTLRATAEATIDKLTKEGAQLDRTVTNKAMMVCKNLTKALLLNGLWGVSAAAMHAIMSLKKAYSMEDGA